LNMELEEFLSKQGIWHRFIKKPETIHTADASKVTGIELKRITKNLVSVTDGKEYVLIIVPGNRKVDMKRVASILGVNKVSLVPFNEAEKISGYPPGGTPSLGHKRKFKVILDKSLTEFDTIFCGGGSRDKLLELKTRDVIRINEAIIADITK